MGTWGLKVYRLGNIEWDGIIWLAIRFDDETWGRPTVEDFFVSLLPGDVVEVVRVEVTEVEE